MLQNVGVLYILTKKIALRHSGVPFLNILTSKSGPRVWCFAHFDKKLLCATAACHFWTSELQKWLRDCGVLCILTCKCDSRHIGVPFFRIATLKMAPALRCFGHFDSWLTNVLRATAACHFSGSQLQKWLRPWGVLSILTYKCASRHSGVPFFTCLLSSYLRTRRFSEATFRTSGTTNHWKNTAILGVANISRTCACFLLTLHACWSPFCWLDISTLLDTSTLLCFSTLHIVGS